MTELFIGIDLGGTHIKAGLIDRSGRLLAESRRSTNHADGVEAVLERIAGMSRQIVRESLLSWDDVSGIGVGMPGLLDTGNGLLLVSGNLGWRNIPIREMLGPIVNKPISLVNDANAAALAEAWIGAGTGVSHIVCVTIGTGIGSGIIVDGDIFEGYTGMAGDIGHIPILFGENAASCKGCGKKGCLESVSSETGMLHAVRARIANGEKGALSESLPTSAKSIFDAVNKQDRMAIEIVNHAADALARVLANLALIINPGRFIIGGGVSLAGDRLLTPLREAFAHHTNPTFIRKTDIVQAQLGNTAGLIGAAKVAMTQGG